MLIGIEREAHGRDPTDTMRGENLVDLALGRFDASDEALELVIFAHFGGNRIERARKVVRNAQNIARKAGYGIGTRIGDILFKPAANILRFCLGIQDTLLRRCEFFLQFAQFVEDAFTLTAIELFFRNSCQFRGCRIV